MPSRRLTISYPFTLDRAARLDDANRRARGDYRTIVLRCIQHGNDPSPADLAGALRQTSPEPTCRFPLSALSRPAQIRAITARDRTQTRDTAAAWLDAHGITAATAQEYRAARAEALALAEARIASDTRAIIDYVVTRYVLRTRAVKPGRKTAPRTLADEHRIASAYFAELARARESHEADSRQPRDVAAVALRRTAAAYGISRRTVERIVAGLAAT